MENFYKRKELRKYLPKVDNPNVHLHQLDKLPFRMIVCAPSGSGKSNFLLNLIDKSTLRYISRLDKCRLSYL